ncbi:hypothetical protein INT47_002153 [Mucor saturninus]|uniref:C2H2-type domain-containing protein n=1 Tax=Mucor saturninus TaxID=64648 RepID=A0A8H7R0J9_9FUNG|nr:hypothetical protein INT47_002153 [Mucor saturninus]
MKITKSQVKTNGSTPSSSGAASTTKTIVKRVKKWIQPTLSFKNSVLPKIKTEPEEPSIEMALQGVNLEETVAQNISTRTNPNIEDVEMATVEQETYFVQIKQDDTIMSSQEESIASSPIDVSEFLPDPEDPNFYCRVCDKQHSVKRTFRQHCIKHHKMNLPPNPKVLQLSLLAKFPNILPDPDDPDYNCCVCQKNYSDKYNYRRHLRTCHKMDLKPLKPFNVKHPHITPDENDPNSYCAACEKTFCDKWGYRSHLEAIHNLALKGGQRTNKRDGILPDEDDPNGYCRQCNKTLESLRSYRNHLRKIHGMILKPRGRALLVINAHVKPDENDPNNYCIVCKRQYREKRGYRVHLATMHNMELQNLKPRKALVITEDSTVKPDQDDPNFYCCLCEKNYESRPKYRTHLSKSHKMVLRPLNPSRQKNNTIPNRDDPNFYCIACEKYYASRALYRKHVGRVHKIRQHSPAQQETQAPGPSCRRDISQNSLQDEHVCQGNKPRVLYHTVKVEDLTNVKPDEDDPNFYCCLCQKNSPDKRTFNNHLKVVHNMTIYNNTYLPPPMTEPLPDIHHPDFYCSLCKRNLSSLDNFHRHLRTNHKMKFTIPRKTHDVIPHPELKPDEFDPNLECIACEKKFSCSTGFRSHLRKIHKMTLSAPRKHRRIRHPYKMPDPHHNHP